MSTVVRPGSTTAPAGRMRALARAESTLFLRNKGTLFAALFVPLVLPFSAWTAADGMDLEEAGLSIGTVVLPASIGFSLLFTVYVALVGAFVARREELVLKRLRTGELRDVEILTGTALPAVATGLVQSLLLAVGCSVLLDIDAPPAPHLALVGAFVARREELVLKRLHTGELRDVEILTGTALPAVATGLVQSLLLAVGCSVLLDIDAPPAPHLAVIGLLLGLVMCAALAALTASFSRTTESAQVTSMPLMLVSFLGSGITVPLEVLPDRLATVCEFLPLTPVITLVRGAWTGDLSAYEALAAVLAGLAWTVLSVFAVRRWFRWEPRR